jgi:hypothetical protein
MPQCCCFDAYAAHSTTVCVLTLTDSFGMTFVDMYVKMLSSLLVSTSTWADGGTWALDGKLLCEREEPTCEK